MSSRSALANGVTEILRVLDGDLPLLAARAAVELDRFRLGRETDLAAVKLLAGRIKNSIEEIEAGGTKRFSMDPPTVTVISYAAEESKWTSSPATMEDLVKVACAISKDLSEPSTLSDVTRVRDFCIALSRCSASYLNSIFSARPTHPFRRVSP